MKFPKPVPREPRPRKPLARKRPMRKRAPRRIARETPAEKFYKRWIHTQPCVCGCNRPVQQSHLRYMTGLGRKEDNFYSIAQCSVDHGHWTEGTGRFAGLSKFQRFAFFMGEIQKAHRVFKAQHGCRPYDWRGRTEGDTG